MDVQNRTTINHLNIRFINIFQDTEAIKQLYAYWAPGNDAEVWYELIPWNEPTYRMFGAFDGSKLVGFIDVMARLEPRPPYARGLGFHFYVLPNYRRTRIPYRLYKCGIAYAKSLGLTCVSAFASTDTQAWWKRRGFSPRMVEMVKEI